MTDHIDTSKAQLAALGEHQPLCLAAENEVLKHRVAVMANALRELREYVEDLIWDHDVKSMLTYVIDESLSGNALEPEPVAREGWQWVPVEPTELMINSGHSAWSDGETDVESFAMAYRAMLDAAPKQQGGAA